MNKWIPVTEALPDDGSLVLVTYKDGFDDGSGTWLEVNVAYLDDDTNEWCTEAIDLKYEVIENVLAWMPMPKPYKPQFKDIPNVKRRLVK